MNGPKKVSAEEGSTAIGGNVYAPVVNVHASDGSPVSVTISQQIAQELPSYLGEVIIYFAQQSLSEYGLGPKRSLTMEISEKLSFNNLSEDHRIVRDYLQYALILEQSYLGIEQENADVRFLVKRRAAVVYESHIREQRRKTNPPIKAIDYVRANADSIVEYVIGQLLAQYAGSSDVKVKHEIAHLAISLIVADAVVDCDVLERH